MIWSPDAVDGRYRNPIIYEDYSDPDVCLGKDAYYMTASSFSFVPGLPILKSYDLVHWKLVNYALRRIPEFRYREPVHGCGVWAPAIRYHDGTYYIVFPMPDEGLYMIYTENPEGEWSAPVKIYDGAGLIDPCPFFDDDGRVFLVNGVAKSRIGYKSVLMMSELSPDLTRIIKGPVKIYDGTTDGNVTIEGPKLYKRDGYYYIFAPAGGVKTGWQVVLRSKNLYSGWEPHISLRQGSTGVNGPHQGALVTDGAGKDWFLHFQDVFAAGRITHLQPVAWTGPEEGGWPVIGKQIPGEAACGEPVLTEELPTPMSHASVFENAVNETAQSRLQGKKKSVESRSEKNEEGRSADSLETFVSPYNGENPPLPWQWNANPEKDWLSVPTMGTVRLSAVQSSPERPLIDCRNLFLRRVSAPELAFSASLDISELAEGCCAGICLSGTSYGGIGILRKEDGLYIRKIRGKQVFDCGAVYADETAEDIPLTLHGETQAFSNNGFSGRAEDEPAEGEKRSKHPNGVGFRFGNFRVSLLIRNTNGTTATSEKPPYRPEDEAEVLHPEEEVTLSVEAARDGTKSASVQKYSLSLPMAAGRWTGAKYGFFVVSYGKHRVSAVSIRDTILE